MLTKMLIDLAFGLLTGLFSLIPDISWNVPVSVVSGVTQFFHVIFYIVPMDTVFAIASIVIALHSFRIVIALIKTLWDVLPFA